MRKAPRRGDTLNRPEHRRTIRTARPLELVNTLDRPSIEQFIDRDIRMALPARDLTGLILGDPPVGRSALDKKIMKERAGE